jgi:undecaprenyl-diphosphatase
MAEPAGDAGQEPKNVSEQELSEQELSEQELPEQELGDTWVAPWKAPTPEEKAKAHAIRRTLYEALTQIQSEEMADAIVERLEKECEDEDLESVAESHPPVHGADQAVQHLIEAAQSAPEAEKPEAVLDEMARVIATADEETQEVVAEAAQEVFNPEKLGGAPVVKERQREYLRRAVLKRLKPVDALDARLFLAINHLPHTRLLNRIFYTITFIFTGGAAWFALMALITGFRPRFGWRMARGSVLPLIIATSLVEYPIKSYFRRKRPFITIIKALTLGMKPSTWSFPSGHSASAFAGAWLFSHYLPRWRSLWYTLASLVAFSRVYLGDHYPGDVVTGSALGALFAWISRWLLSPLGRFIK